MESRLTFRDIQGDVAWQRQLRDRYSDEGTPPVPHLDLGKAIVKPVSRAVATQIILKYEWLGTLPFSANYFLGIFFGDFCAGVTCIQFGSVGANPNCHKEFDITRHDLAYLVRGANTHWSPPGANSKLVSWTCKLIAREKRAKLIIAYADTDAGEIGTIYQASNWHYIGVGSSTLQWVAPNGRILDQKHPSNLRTKDGKTRPRKDYVKALKDAGWYEQKTNPKHRYVQILDHSDKALVELVESKTLPYPKRLHAGEAK